MANEILLKVVIDGKEATVSLSEINQGIEDAKTNVPGLGEELDKSYNKLSSEFLKQAAATEESAESLAEWMRTQNLTVEIIEESIQELSNETRALGINTEEWKQKSAALSNLKNAYGKTITGNKQLAQTSKPVVAGANKMNMAFNQMGYVVNDASVFLIDFRMGMMGIANNIPMVVQMLSQAKAEIANTGSTMKKALTSAIMGPGGLMIAINGLMLLLTILPGLFSDSTEEIKEQADEVDKLREKYDNLSVAENKRTLSKLRLEKKVAESDLEQAKGTEETIYRRYGRSAEKHPVSIITGRDEAKMEEAKERIKSLNASIQAITGSLEISQTKIRKIFEGEYDLSSITNIKEAIEQLSKEYENVRTDAERSLYDSKLIELEGLLDKLKRDNSGEKEFDLKNNKLEQAQSHAEEMAKLEGKSEAEILKITAAYLQERISLHRAYNQSSVELENELIQTQKELNNLGRDEQKAAVKKYYDEVKFDDENYLQYRIGLIEEEAKKMQESADNQINIELWKKTEINKLMKEKSDYFKKLTAEEVKAAKKAAQEKVKAIEDYYNVLRFDDESYYEYEALKIEQSKENLIANGFAEVDAEAYKLAMMKQLDEEYYDWKWQKIVEDYHFFFKMIDPLGDAYDTFWDTILDKDMTGKERWILIRDQMYQSFVSMIAEMAKQYIQNLIISAAIGDTIRAAEVVKGTATGTALAKAYAPAAAFASIMSFGGAAAAGSVGLIATVSLAKFLAVPQMPGYEKGGAIVGEKGVEIIAPAKDFASGMDQLIIQTVAALERDLASGRSTGSYESSERFNSTLEKIERHLENPPPALSYLSDRQAKDIVRRGLAMLGKSNL